MILTILLLFYLSAPGLTERDWRLGRHAFKGYCGGEQWVTRPLPEYELLQVQVVHRHGARTLWTPMDCWKATPTSEPEMPHFECDLPFSIGIGHTRHRLTKHYLQPGHCGLGSLLGQAETQFKDLAASLNQSYGHIPWWKRLEPPTDLQSTGSVRLYSCDNERNLGSLDLLAAQLFPEKLEASVDTMPPKEDPFELPGFVSTSPCDGSTLPKLQEIHADNDFRDFASRWRSHANVTWNHMLYDCILTSGCAGLPLPQAISSELADEALYWGFQQSTAAVFYSNWTTWDASQALQWLAQQMHHAIEHGLPKLALWSTHDSTMIYLLNALHAWDNIWPGYATALVLELYADRTAHEFLVRILRDGQPLKLGLCDDKVLCPLTRFLQAVESTKPPATPCTPPTPTMALSLLSQAWQPTGLAMVAVALAAAAFTFGLHAGFWRQPPLLSERLLTSGA